MFSQNGNALFLILIAVALFGALSYAITQSGRGGGNISREEAALRAARYVQMAGAATAAVNRMLVLGLATPETLDFSSDEGASTNTANTNCLTNTCRVYHPDGGGISTPVTKSGDAMPDLGSSYLTTAGNVKSTVLLVSVAGVGTDLPDIVLFIRGLDEQTCDEINRQFGIYETDDTMLSDVLATADYRYYQGDMDPLPFLPANALGDDDPRIEGHHSFCRLQGPLGGHYLAQVLIAR